MKHSKISTYAFVLAMIITAPAFSEDMVMPHAMASMNHEAAQSDFDGVMMDMHKAMNDVKPTGNTDIDFVQGMIPHHQGAIDMAEVELAKGKDPEIRKLAEGIIKAQKEEIAMMQKWLTEHKAK